MNRRSTLGGSNRWEISVEADAEAFAGRRLPMFSCASGRMVATPKNPGAKAIHMPARQSLTIRPGTVRAAKAKNVKPWCNIHVTFSLTVWPLFAAKSYFSGQLQCRIIGRVKQMNRAFTGVILQLRSPRQNLRACLAIAHFACKPMIYFAGL